MQTLATIALAVVPLLVPASAAAQPGSSPARRPATLTLVSSSSADQPIRVQLSTLVDHVETLAGQFVQLPPCRVSRIVSPTLVELRDAREHGPYRFHMFWRYDRLLAVVPAGVKLSRGDHIILAGSVRTVDGARLTGDLTGVSDDVVKDRRNRVLLVATSVATVDGVTLAGGR